MNFGTISWNKCISTPTRNPRVGQQIIRFGAIEKIEKKFDNLKLFYDKVMPVVGWNKYHELNIAYTNQVIGIKKTKK